MSIRISDLPEENDPQREDVFPVVSDAAGATRKLSLGTLGLEFGFGLRELVVFESSGTFEKGDYPWLRAVRVKVQGGGGAGGGTAATTSDEGSCGSGGGGGSYAESLLLAAQVPSSAQVTVGSGGAASAGSAGNNGGSSLFDSLVEADGGIGGLVESGSTSFRTRSGGNPVTGGVGQLIIGGSGGGAALRGDPIPSLGGSGGSSYLGGGGSGTGSGGFSTGRDGVDGSQYGGGGSGAQAHANQPARPGGDGADGVVILELYA